MMLDPYIRLRDAVVLDKLSIVKLLLRRYPDLLHAKDAQNKGWSLLHYSSFHGNYLVCVYLIQLGCDINGNISRDFDGRTPIHVSVLRGDEQTCHLLLQHYPNAIEYKDFDGNSPFLLACKYGNYKILTLLISCAANIKETNDSGDNGLHLALKNDHLDCCKVLLQSGLNNDMLNNDKMKPSDVAFTFEIQKKFMNTCNEVVPMMGINSIENSNLISSKIDSSSGIFNDNNAINVSELKTFTGIQTSNPISDAIGNPFKSKKILTSHMPSNTFSNTNQLAISSTNGPVSTPNTKDSDDSSERRIYGKGTNSEDFDIEAAVATPLLSGNNNKLLYPLTFKNDSSYSLSHASINKKENSFNEDEWSRSDDLSFENFDSSENEEVLYFNITDSNNEQKKNLNKRKSLLAKVPISKVRNSDSHIRD
ncbi:hypothetical protein QEN19_002330 [Hanseniaspora menglaensis]